MFETAGVAAEPPPAGADAREDTLFLGNVEIRRRDCEALIDHRRVGLTVREFQILVVLIERYDRVVPRPEIYQLVWGNVMPHRDRSVDVFVRKVRRKLELTAPDWEYVHTHFGIGYRFTPERRPSA